MLLRTQNAFSLSILEPVSLFLLIFLFFSFFLRDAHLGWKWIGEAPFEKFEY